MRKPRIHFYIIAVTGILAVCHAIMPWFTDAHQFIKIVWSIWMVLVVLAFIALILTNKDIFFYPKAEKPRVLSPEEFYGEDASIFIEEALDRGRRSFRDKL